MIFEWWNIYYSLKCLYLLILGWKSAKSWRCTTKKWRDFAAASSCFVDVPSYQNWGAQLNPFSQTVHTTLGSLWCGWSKGTLSMERTSHWSSRASSDTVSFTFTYHTWQFIVFAIFTITAFALLLVQFFILNSRLGSLANPFHLIDLSFPTFLLDWFHRLSDHLMFLFCSTAGCYTKTAFSWFSNALFSMHFYYHHCKAAVRPYITCIALHDPYILPLSYTLYRLQFYHRRLRPC